MNDGLVWSPPRPRPFFMHLPKTAGMALRLFLGNQYPIDRIMPANDWRELLSVEIADLDRYSLFQGHFSCGLMDLLPPDIAPIVFLREPVARTVSHLKHMRRDPSLSPVVYRLAAGRSLDELVRDEYVMKLCCDVQSSLLCNYISGQSILAGLRRDQMAGPIPGSNWYACEAAERGGHRWTGPLAQTTLELPLAAGFDFEIAMHVLIDDLADLTVYRGDAELPLRRDATEGRMHRIAFRVPAQHVAVGGLTALRFETKKLFQPSAADPGLCW